MPDLTKEEEKFMASCLAKLDQEFFESKDFIVYIEEVLRNVLPWHPAALMAVLVAITEIAEYRGLKETHRALDDAADVIGEEMHRKFPDRVTDNG